MEQTGKNRKQHWDHTEKYKTAEKVFVKTGFSKKKLSTPRIKFNNASMNEINLSCGNFEKAETLRFFLKSII